MGRIANSAAVSPTLGLGFWIEGLGCMGFGFLGFRVLG